jgi:hypothetical protein
MAKNLLNKYVWLVETIYKAKRITFEEINEKWLANDLSEGIELALRTFHKWRIAAEEMFGLIIECERKGGYHYYIANAHELKGCNIRNWLLNTISVSNVLIDNQHMKDRILLEEIPSGQEYLYDIIEAMKHSQIINMTYQSYWRDKSNNFNVEPYCVKLFKQRWYMITRSTYDNRVLVYSLDRILSLDILVGENFKMPNSFSPSEFFDEYYGVIINGEQAVEKINLKVSARQANYLRSLPLHHSQQEIERTTECSIFQLTLCPTYDFQQEILRNGEDREVLEPSWLRTEIADNIKKMYEKYHMRNFDKSF